MHSDGRDRNAARAALPREFPTSTLFVVRRTNSSTAANIPVKPKKGNGVDNYVLYELPPDRWKTLHTLIHTQL